MKGSVYPYGPPCPKCGGEWSSIRDSVTGDVTNILCMTCFTMPVRFAIDGRAFKNRKGCVGRLFRDERGELFYHFQGAKRVLETVRHAWDKDGPERFDPTKHSRPGRESLKLSECSREWILHLEEKGRQHKRGGSRAYVKRVELQFRLHILPALGDIDVRELTADDIEKFSLSIGKAMEQSSVKSCMQVLMSVLKRYCFRKQVMDKVPPFPEGWSATPHKKRRVINAADQRVLIDRMPEEVRLLLEVQAAIGCRPGEACALKRKDVLDDGRLMIQGSICAISGEWKETKTGAARLTDPLPDELAARLRALPVLPEAFLFTKGDGKPFNPNRLSDRFKDVRGAEYSDVTLNTFARHSLASMVAREARQDGIKEAARRMGNTVQIAERSYVHDNDSP